MVEHTTEEYINAQRIIDMMLFGPIETIYNTEQLIEEYKKVETKSSKLSRRLRERVYGVYTNALQKFNEDSENGNNVRWDSMQKVIGLTTKAINYIKDVRNS